MVNPSLRRKKEVVKKTPGGTLKKEYRRKVYSKHKCAICKDVLKGTPRGKPSLIRSLTRSKRRPSRPFGGQLCSKCSRKVIAMKTKYKLKLIDIKNIPLSLREYVIGDKTWQKI